MHVFDNLIFNFDRNHGNQLLDETRQALVHRPHALLQVHAVSLPSKDSVLVVATLWERSQTLDRETIAGRLDPYLDLPQMKAFSSGAQLLVKHIGRSSRIAASPGPPLEPRLRRRASTWNRVALGRPERPVTVSEARKR